MSNTKYISRRFDEAAILSALASIAFSSRDELSGADYMVLAALRRSSPDWELSLADTASRLSNYSGAEMAGLVNNVKGILHEMEFVRIENEDGDPIVAALFSATNHRAVDVQMMDRESGDVWELQLKATSDMSAINGWMEANPDTEIRVTDELAEQMGLESSGFSNEDLSIQVQDFVNRLIQVQANGDGSIWDAMPPLAAASAGIVVFELWRRQRTGQITMTQFRALALRVLGIKAGKYSAIFAALSVPGLNIAVGAYLLGSFILTITRTVGTAPSFKPFAVRAYKARWSS